MVSVDHPGAVFSPSWAGSGRSLSRDPVEHLRAEEGSAMVELSLILPILILLLLGTLDIAMILQKAIIVADSARAGAEYGAAKWDYASDTLDMQGLSSYVSSYTVANYNAVAAITCSCGVGGAVVSCSGTCSGGVSPVQYAQVTATASVPLLFGVSGLPGTVPLKSVAKVRVAWRGGL